MLNKYSIKQIDKYGFDNYSLKKLNCYLIDTEKKIQYNYKKFFKFINLHGLSYKKLSKLTGKSVGLLEHWSRGYIKYSQWKELMKLINDNCKYTNDGLCWFEKDLEIKDFIDKII